MPRPSFLPFFPHLPHHLCAAAALAAAIDLRAQLPLAVSPADRQSLEGSSFTHLPLGRASTRMQTLHSDLPPGLVLTGHGYRRDAAGVRGIVDGFAAELQVTLSISPNLPTRASTTFANNAGPNPVVVLPRQWVTFPPTLRPSLDPASTFELVLPYSTPFQMPASGGTLCVDIEIWGNQSAGGSNRNLSIYLDSHDLYSDGRAEQPGFRFGTGCPAPGQTTAPTHTPTLWLRQGLSQFDVALRGAGREDGSGLLRAWFAVGALPSTQPWPTNPNCTLWGTADAWFLLPANPDASGNLDASLTGLPALPPGYRLWCQAGSAHLGTGALAFSDGATVVTPPPGPVPMTASRVANSTDRSSATGTVAYAVPVMAFF
jgi:hypothetical protein